MAAPVRAPAAFCWAAFIYSFASSGCGTPCNSSTWVATSNAGTSAPSIGVSIVLNGAATAAVALWHLDEGSWSGTAGEVTDSSGNGYHGIAEHGATTAGSSPALSGSPGTCFYGAFNGSTHYVQLPSTLPHVGGNFSGHCMDLPDRVSRGRIFTDDMAYNGYGLTFDDAGANKVRLFSQSPSFQSVDSSVG